VPFEGNGEPSGGDVDSDVFGSCARRNCHPDGDVCGGLGPADAIPQRGLKPGLYEWMIGKAEGTRRDAWIAIKQKEQGKAKRSDALAVTQKMGNGTFSTF
jgi:hypothetical protein